MSKQERKISLDDIQVVQNLIERCLQLYMSQSEVISRLLDHAKIEPSFTKLVWQSLEAQNEEFFRAYHLKLMVKDQILRFNQLLERQVELTHHISQTGTISTPIPVPNGPHVHSNKLVPNIQLSETNPLVRNSAYRGPAPSVPYMKQDVRQVIGAIPNVYANGSHSVQPSMVVNMASHDGNIDVPLNMLWDRNSYSRIMQGFNGVTPKSEGGYPGNSPFMFTANNNIIEHRNGIGGATISPFNSTEPNGQAFHDPILAPNSNSVEFFGQMTGNFGLSDLTADFANSTGMIESYLRSPFPTTDASILDPRIVVEQRDIRRLDAKPEGFSYKDFHSD